MNVYETLVIIDASLSDEAITAATDKIKEVITSSGGEVLKVDPWGRRRLAYEIKKQARGFYALVLYKAPPETIKKLEEFFKVQDTVVKYLNVRLEKKQREAALSALAAAPAAEAAAPEPEAAGQ
ncbi:MAG: 30S ribosomal protein S6 [Thermodesulfovibrionales bacterium]